MTSYHEIQYSKSISIIPICNHQHIFSPMQSIIRGSRLKPLSCPTLCPTNGLVSQSSIRTSSTRSFASLTRPHNRSIITTRTQQSKLKSTTRSFTNTTKMSSNTFSNTDTGDKPADPYKEKNLEDPSTKEKIDDLVAFVEKSKFCMMTTRIAPKGLLVSRCMALAGKVRSIPAPPLEVTRSGDTSQNLKKTRLTPTPGRQRHRPSLPRQHRIRQNRRPKIRPRHQPLLPQPLRRMGLDLRARRNRHRRRARPQILLPSAQGLDRRPGRRRARWRTG